MHYFLSLLFIVFSLSIGSSQNIYRTACNGNLTRLDSMLMNTDINAQDFRGRNLLHWAVACNKKEVFDHLIAKGIDINAQDNQGMTPTHMAIRFDSEEYFDLLVSFQKDNGWKKQFGASLLEKAVLKGSGSFVRKLVESGIAVDTKNEKGSTALEIAERIGALEIAELLVDLGADQKLVRQFTMEGSYMGQYVSDLKPAVFAPNFISTEEYEFGSVFNADATEFYYGVDVNGRAEIRYSKMENGIWSQPVVILSHESYGYNDPFLSPDEKRLYFISKRPLDGTETAKGDYDIWYVEKIEEGWSEPINAGPNINTEFDEYYISFTKDGTMYFASDVNQARDGSQFNHDIFYSAYKDGVFQPPVRLGEAVNTESYEADVFVDPNETYLIFCAQRPEGLGRGDLYISFKTEEGTWSEAMNMGNEINTVNHELCPFVTMDGKYFIYTSNEDIYWVGTEIIYQLRERLKDED